MGRKILSEKSLVVILFVMVFIIFSFAQEDTRKIEQMYLNSNSSTSPSPGQAENTETKAKTTGDRELIPSAQLR